MEWGQFTHNLRVYPDDNSKSDDDYDVDFDSNLDKQDSYKEEWNQGGTEMINMKSITK